jgi:hypothetical protein
MILRDSNKLEISDSFYDDALSYLHDGTLPQNMTQNQIKQFKTKSNLFFIDDDKLYTRISSKTLNVRSHIVEVVPPRERDNKLQEMYEDPTVTRNARDSFYIKVALKYLNISRRYVQEWLRKQENYQLHYHQAREKSLRPEEQYEICEKFQIDLIDMTNYTGSNARKGWIVTVIDCFSKYSFARMITTKHADKVLEALKSILDENYELVGQDPKVIHSDNGSEFIAKIYKDYLHDRGIKIFYGQTYYAQQQGTIESFNKRLKGLIFSYITSRQQQNLPYSHRYYDKLQDFVYNLNHSYHTSIKARPVDIHKSDRLNVKQQILVKKHVLDFYSTNKVQLSTLQPHDFVRIHIITKAEERKNKQFAKKYVPQWSKEIYQIVRRLFVNDPLRKTKYKVRMVRDADCNDVNKLIPRYFYRQDIQHIVSDQ